MQHYRDVTEQLGQRIDAAITPAIESIGRSRIVTNTAGALDRFANSFDRESPQMPEHQPEHQPEQSTPDKTTKEAAPAQASPAIIIADSKCTDGAIFNDQTTKLSTISRLRLRSAPSIHAVTIRIIESGTIVTARRISCGNWTEIVHNQKPIGFVFSAFLTTP